ncbi:MAG TPA: hypothetical protein VLE21_04805 [Candidatus Nitrosocosmicus sp.]|nr:hypothetical protein [Candidatus Nitrosocosmicus sp.]
MTCKCSKEMADCPEDKKIDGKCPMENVSSIPMVNTQDKPAEDPCPSGKLDGDGKCVPAANEAVYNGPNADEINQRLKEQAQMIDELKQRINNQTQLNEIDAQLKEIKAKENSVTRVSTVAGHRFDQKDINYIANEGVSALKKYGHYSFEIDMDPKWVRETLSRKKVDSVQEAISFSGTQDLTMAADSDVFVLPGGKYLKSIRDLVKFKEIPKGYDTAKWYKGDIPDHGTITEGSDTSSSTHTLTTVTLTADTVTGVAQTIKGADIEDFPGEMFDYLAQTARAQVLEHEATLVFTTAAAAATPGLWINGNSGATITHTDIASMTQTPTSIAVALQHYETQGYDTSFGNIYYALHPKALRELRTSTLLTTLVQQGDANITKTGRLTHLYGIELIPTTALDTDDNTTTDVYNNVFGVKGHTFILGSKRELTIDLQKIPKQSAYDWTWSQRKNAGTFDATSFVRCSTGQ